MKDILINFDKGTVISDNKEYLLTDPEAFNIVSDAWLRAGWDAKYVYSFTWLGRPIIQQPEDMFRIQELIYQLKPDFIIDIGIAHGGSLIFYASLCNLIGKGKVIGVDIEIRPHNRVAIENHPLYKFITMFEGDSTDPIIIEKIKNIISNSQNVIIILDGDHTKDHVLEELNIYSQFVSKGSYIIACDGYIKELVTGGPRTESDWFINNPKQAAIEFVKSNPDFMLDEPKFIFNEGVVNKWISYWSGGFIKRL